MSRTVAEFRLETTSGNVGAAECFALRAAGVDAIASRVVWDRPPSKADEAELGERIAAVANQYQVELAKKRETENPEDRRQRNLFRILGSSLS